MKPIKTLLALSLTLGISFLSYAQNTLVYNDSIGSPDASLSQLDWISGYWKGEAFGGVVEELWSPAYGGSMMCAFKLTVANEVKFYEIVTISEVEGTLILRLKHFHSNLKGWEEKDETVDFKLVKIEEGKVYFDGFTFEKVDEDHMNIYVVVDGKEGRKEVLFAYEREAL